MFIFVKMYFSRGNLNSEMLSLTVLPLVQLLLLCGGEG